MGFTKQKFVKIAKENPTHNVSNKYQFLKKVLGKIRKLFWEILRECFNYFNNYS